MVNQLLESEHPIPFQFSINGTILKTFSLEQYLTAHGISSEITLALEYSRATLSPPFKAAFEHDEWVNCVDVLSETSPAGPGPERIVSGSYDSTVQVWNKSSQLLVSSPDEISPGGHSCYAIKTVKFISPGSIASAGMTRWIRIWNYVEDAEGFSATLSPQIDLLGHEEMVYNIAIHQPSNRIVSASADHTVGLWSYDEKDEGLPAPEGLVQEAKSNAPKRHKSGPSTSASKRGPLLLMKSHTNRVTDTMFDPSDKRRAYSVSEDNSLKTWDLNSGTCVDTLALQHPLFSLAALPSLSLLAAGNSDAYISLIDVRVSPERKAMTLRGHRNKVSSLAADPHSSHGLLSGSFDGTCRIWDVRSSEKDKCVHTIERESAKGQGYKTGGEGAKVFGVCWDRHVGIVSGSEDRKVQINEGTGLSEA